MNKKFSTLFASLLLAGGLFPSVHAETFEEATAKEGYAEKYFIVRVNGQKRDNSQDENKGYAVAISEWNMLSSTTSASVASTAKLSEYELWTIKVTDDGKYQLINAATGEALSADGYDAFCGDKTALWFETPSSSSKRGYKGDATEVDCNYTTADDNRVWGYDLEETDYRPVSSVVEGAISAGQPYLLMGGLVNSQVWVDSNEDGKAELTGYTKDDYKSYWYVEVDKTQKLATFKNKKSGETLTDNDGKLVYAKVNDDYTFDNNEEIPLYVVGGGADRYETVALGFVENNWYNFTATQLISITGAGFQMDIKKYVDGGSKDKELAQNPFTGLLKPVVWNNQSAGTVKEASGYNYMLQNEEGNLIVVDLDNKYAETTSGTKYALTTISPKALANALASSKAEVKNRYAYKFDFYSSDAFEIGVDQRVYYIEALAENSKWYRLGTVALSGTNTLSAEIAYERPFYLDELTIKIGTFNTIDVEALLKGDPTFFTVKNVATKKTSTNYGKVLGLDKDGDAAMVKTSEALTGYPETQWAITYDEDENELTFTNRENTKASIVYSVAGLYKTNTSNVFVNVATKDTIEIKPVAKFEESDGYLRLNADDLRDEQYYVAAASSVFNNVAYLVENHNSDHQIGLDTDKDKATVWNVATAMHYDHNNLGEEIASRPDTLVVKSILGYYNAKGEYKETVDAGGEGTVMLKLLAYTFQNDANNEYLAYDNTADRYATGQSGSKTGYKASDAQYFVVKTVGEEVYNLIKLEGYTPTVDDDIEAFVAEGTEKVYSGDGASKGILNNIGMYSQTENDLFVIEKKDAPMYRQIAMSDTIKIFRNESVNEAQVVYEKGEFLSIANAVQFPDINPAIYVDTAYINRGNNNRWEYLLAVDAKHWDSKLECEIPDHPKHAADTTTGRFLVNLIDSANVYYESNLHDNKFINEEDGETYAKLGFVEGYHTHDTLYLKRPDGTYDKLPMDRSDYTHSIAKFAFRYVDSEEGSFIIETGRKNYVGDSDDTETVSTGYLKWLNGVLVVVDDEEKAEVFNLNENEGRTPTANDAIAASEVSVVATQGAVIIKGAANKKVVISNILGQTIANTVISSDNATIAAPAGVVVVAVEGETAVKVVVK